MNLNTHNRTRGPVIELHPRVEESQELIIEHLPHETESGYGVRVTETISGDYVFELTWPWNGDHSIKKHGRVAIRKILSYRHQAKQLADLIRRDETPVQTLTLAAERGERHD